MADEIDLLSQPFMDWESVTKGATYNGSDNKGRLDLFDNWSAYAKDYSAKQLAEAPEDKKLEAQGNADSINGFIEEQSNFLKNKYDLVHQISKMETSAEVIDALRDPDKLRQEGFSDEVIFALRKGAEKEFAPVMARSQADTLSEDEAGKALWEDPGYLDAATNFAFRALPVIATAALKTVEGVTDLAGKANEINPFASDFDKDLGRSVAKKVTSAAKQGTEWINNTFPSDPRLSENTLAATEGLAQVPFNLATAALGTVPNAITNYGQLYQENVDTYVPQITEQRYKDEIRSGRASATTPFKQWESLLSEEDKKDIRAEAATKAMLFAVPQAAIETLADKLLLKSVPLPDSVKSKLMSWRNARPVTYMGARVASNAFVKTASEMGSEGVQKITGNIGGATNTGDWSFEALTKDVEPSMIGGAFGGAGAAALMLPNTFRTERAIDWAQGIVNGQDEAAQKDISILKAKDADIESKEYKAAYERAKAKDRTDYEHQLDLAFINDPEVDKNSVDFKNAEKRIQTREDEANWVLDRVGDSRADKTRAARYQAVSDTRREYENALTKHVRENEPNWSDPSKEYQTRFQQIKDQFAKVRQGAKEVGSNLNVDAAEAQAIEQLQRGTSEKAKTADKLLNDFIGSVDSDGPGRAIFARQELARLYPDSVFSTWFKDDATVVEVLNAREKGEINDKTDLEGWLNTTVPTTKATGEAKTETAPKPQGMMTTGQRLDAFRMAEDNLESADEPTKKEFGRLKEDIQFWNGVISDKEASEQDKAEAAQRLPDLENALLEIATGGVSSQSTNQNEQNQAANQSTLPAQEVPATSAESEGAGAGGLQPTIRVKTMEGEEVDQTENDYIGESRGIVRALESGEMTPEAALQNVEAVRMEIEAAPELTPEQKTQWLAPFQNIPAIIEQRGQQTTPTTSAAQAASIVPESTGSSELIAGQGTLSQQPTPARMGGVSGDVVRTETGETVFRNATDGTETVLRVKEDSIDKDPAALTVDDFEGGDGTPLISEAAKEFSVLPENDRPARPFFRSQSQPQDGQAAKLPGSYPGDAGSTPAPATPDIAAISADVQANPDIHRFKDGNRKLVSREAAVTILSQLPETLTNKDVATLAKDSGMTSTNFRKLVALRGDQNAVGSLLNGDMDAELGLFDRATKAPLNDATPAAVEESAPETKLEDTPEWKSLSESSVEDSPEWQALQDTSEEDSPEWQSVSDKFDKFMETVSDLELDADTPRSKVESLAKRLLKAGAIPQKAADEAIRLAKDKGYDREDAVAEAISSLNSDLQYELEQRQGEVRKAFQAGRSNKEAELNQKFEADRSAKQDALRKQFGVSAPKTKLQVSNDTNTESTVVGQSPVDRWVNDSFTALEQAAAELPQSSINASLFREKLTTDEGRAGVREKLGQMFNTVVRNLKISDPVVREEAMEKIFRGALQKQTGEGLTSNVLEDLLTNLQKTGDPFLVKSKGGEVGYSAWLKHRNKQNEFMQAQGKRDMTETLVENEGAPTSASQGVQEEDGEGTGPAFTEGDPDIEAGRSEAKSMQREAVQMAYDRIARSLAGQYGLDRDVVKAAVARHFADKRGVKLDFSELGWVMPSKPKVDKAAAALEAAMPDIERTLTSELTKAIRSAAAEANRLGLLKSDAVEISGTPTLEQIIELGIIDEIKNPDFYNAINEARESKSTDSLMPLLANFDENAIASLQTVTGIVLNDGKQITDKKQLASLNKADMQAVLDSDLLPIRLRQTLQALVDLSGEDGLGLVRNSKNEGFRRLAELYSEQIGNRAPVEVVFNLGLNPSVTGQGLWSTGSNRVHISPFLTREKGLMEATILHEVMHPIWDSKINNYLRGNTAGLNDKELAAITELERLFAFSKAEAQKRLDTITDPDERRIMERNLLGTTNLREFLNEALNHRPFQEFLSELKDPNADGKNSVFRTILNKILELIRGGKVSLDSVLQRAFELSTDMASSNKPLSMEQRTPSQAEYIREQETLKGRSLTEEEVSLAAVNYAMQNPRPRFAETRAQADRLAAEYLSEVELEAYNYDRQRDNQSVLSSDAYEFVSPNDLEETLDLQGAVADLASPRQAQLRDFSNRIHEAFGMQGSTVTDAIGDWADGAEPTTVTEHNDPNISYEDIKVMAALKGALRNQKAVIPFKVDPNGEQLLYDFFIPDKSIEEAREIVAAGGLEFRTLIEQNGGTRVLVFDADGSAREAFKGLIKNNNYEAKYLTGSGEFLGSWDSREEGRETYARTVEARIASLGSEGRNLGPDSPESIRAASLRSLAAEAGLTVAPEVKLVEDLTGQPLSETELESYKVMPMSWSLPPSNRRGDRLLNGLIAGRGKPIGAFRPAFDSEGNFIEGSMPEGDNVEFRNLNAPLGGGNEYLTKAQMNELINARGNDDRFWSRNSFEARRVSEEEELSSVSVPYKEVVDKSLRNVIDKAVAEPAQTAFLKPEEFAKARETLNRILSNPEKAKARGGRTVSLNSPDDSTARKLEKATGQRWDRRLLDARVIHALTESDRSTPNANKIASAPMVPQTLRQADFVARTDFEGRPFLVFAKLYNDPESPTGVRWHFVEAREDTGAFETQYSDTDPQRGRAMAAKVIGVGDATPKKKKTPTGEAGYAQGQAGENMLAGSQGIEPDAYSGQSEVLDNTNVESVQNKILEEITNLTDKQNRLAQSGDNDGAKLVGDQINELTAQFDKLSSSELFSGPVENLGKMWQEAVAKEGGDAFAYGLVSPEVKTFSEIFKTVIGEPSKDFSLKFFSDGVEVSSEEWDELARNNGGAEVTITDPDGGETVLFSGFGAFAVNSAGTATSGSAIYQAFYAWAHNNGKVVGPDTSLSEAGELRRTSQMLSSALRFGTTQHIRPSAEQQIKGWRRVELDKDGTPWEVSDMLREIGGSIFIDDALDSARPRRADGRLTGSKFNQYNEFQTDTVLDTFSGDYSNPDSLIRNFGGYTVKARRVSMEEAQQAWRENIGLLAKKETELVFERIPELKGLSISKDGYLLGPDESYLGSTRPLPAGNTDEYLGTLVSAIRRSDPEFARRIGRATLARALATRFAEANKSRPSLRQTSTEEVRETFSPFKGTLYSAPVAPFQGNVVPGFNASVYTPASSRNTAALKRVLSDPNYTSVRLALTDKRYFAWTEKETLAKANEFIDALKGDLESAYNKSATTYGITPEQTILIRGLAMKRAQSAANVARAEMAKQNTPAARRTDLQFIAQHYSDMAETFAEDLMETASLAGQELRAFRLLADTLSPQSWVKTYKRAATRAQQRKFQKDEVLSEMMDRIKAARREAAKSTTVRMQKALDFAAKRFLPEGASDEEIKAHTDFARVMANQLPVRDAVVQAAVERTVIDGLETIRRSVAPDEQVPESFLRDWENRLRGIASEQINAIIEERLTGGQVDAEAAPELSDNEKEAMREQKITDAWREFSDFPISEIVFSLAKATIVASDSPYANLVRRAQFDPTRIKKLREAVKLSIDTSNEIQMSVGDRRMTVDSLKLRLSEANPNLNEAQLAKLSEAVEAVYNEEVGKATRLALDGIIRKHAEKQTAKKIAKDSDFTSRLLPLVNMGAFSDEAAYNAIAERLRLPAWNQDTAATIEAQARALQEFPEDSIQRQEASVQLMSDILKANVKEARGMQNFGPLMQIASALWSAGILSAPPTQIVNASMTTASVFLQSFTEASGYWYASTKKGATQEQARAYFGDMARAWVFAFGKDANNTSLRAINEAFGALTKGQTKFKSEKLESLSPLEMFKFDPRVAIPGNKMMEAIISGEGKTAIKEAAKMAVGVPMVMAERVWNRDAKGAVKDYMATMKLVGRFMLAADSMNSYGAAVTKQMMMRRYLAQEEGMSPQEIDKVMREAREGGNEAVRDAAMTQVETEAQRGDFGPVGSKTLEVAKARRIEQLIENQTYGTETINAGRDFAATATFNNEPYGVVGFLMDTIFGNTTKVLGLLTKPINPFPKTMSNLINAAIDYTPYGSVRAMGWNLGAGLANNSRFKPYVKEAPERGTPEYYALHSRAVAGTAAMGIIYMMVMSAVKDREEGKEPWFEIHGPGPGDPKARKQFRESGAKAFSLRMGDLVINYTDWPGLNIALAAFGTLYDQLVYSDAEMETSEWFMQTARAIVGTTLNRSALGGASALFNALATSTSSTVFENAVKGIGASYVTGFTRPSFIRWAETMATGQRQETRTDVGWLLSMAPVVSVFRDRPALNILGEPIETSKWDATAGRVVTTQEIHPVLTPLTNANLWVNPPEVYKTYDPSKPSMVRDITQAEFYDYSKAYGETLSGMLTPKQAEYLAEMSKTAPNAAQETLNGFTRMAADIAKAKMGDRGLSKGKELKGP